VSSVALDTNCIVAVAIANHEHRAETVAALDQLDVDGTEIVMLGHALVEAYAVLTRLPGPARVSPALAYQALEASWRDRPVVTLSAEVIWRFLKASAAAELAGGRVYDALMAEAAIAAGVDALLTWNARHFARWSMGPTRVLSPRELLSGG
jgi:predicted nucleic acid-binding protein